MKLGFAAFEYINHAGRKRFYSDGRPVASTAGRSFLYYESTPQPQVDVDDPLGWFIPRLREMGFDAIEGDLSKYLDSPADLDRIGNLLAEHGITLAADYGDNCANPTKTRDDHVKYLTAASNLGVKAIGTGGMPFTHNRFTTDPSVELQYEMIRTTMAPILEVCEELDLKLAFENHADYRVKDLMEYVVKPMNSPNFGIKLDTGNAPLVIEDALDAADACAEVCYSTHFKDMYVSPVTPEGGMITGAPIGRGHCSLEKVARMLHERSTFSEDLVLSLEIGWIPPNQDYFHWLADSVDWCRTNLADYLDPLQA